MTDKEKQYIVAFGKNLKRLREAKGLSTRQFAYAADIAHSSVVRLESGLTNPGITIVIRLADALETDPAALINFRKKGV